MPRRKKKRRTLESFKELKQGTVHAILAIVFFALGVFFTLAAWDQAGVVGTSIYSMFSFLLGAGYFLVPILFYILAVSVFSSFTEYLGPPKLIGAGVFFLSALGLVDILFSGAGIVGNLVSSTLVAFIDLYATIMLLSALLIISVLVIFNFDFTFGFLESLRERFSKESDEEDDPTIAVYDDGDDEDEEYEEEEYEDPEEEVYEEPEEVPSGDTPRAFTYSSVEYTPPPLSLLDKDRGKPGVGDTKANANIIKRTLENFGIHVEMDEVSVGPTVTRYALKPAEGVRISKIVSLQNNLELALAAHPVRIEAPIPGKSLVGVEVPNTAKATVGLARLLGASEFANNDKALLIALGRDITGAAHYANIAKMPHVLIAGSTGSGKSVSIHALITSLLYRNGPEMMRFLMVDPKRVELTLYKNIPHLLTPVITDPKKAIVALKWAVREMERRYDILEAEQVRDISSYHENVLAPALKKVKKKDVDEEELPEPMPYIVIVIDELADLMQTYPRELEAVIVRLAQMSRAVGIHLVLSTQRPSVNVITGLIKANVPARVAFQVASQIDSRTILDTGGAEKLLGAGDMLYLSGEMSKPTRIQGPFISEQEVKKVASFIAKHNGPVEATIDLAQEKNGGNAIFSADLEADEDEDDLYEEARETVIQAGKASTSYLQRKLRVGYSRAARLMDMLEDRGVIGPQEGSKPREVLEGRDEGYGIEDEDEEDDR